MPNNFRPTRISLMLGLVIVILVVPTAIIVLFGWKSAGMLAFVAAMGGLFAMIGDRWRGLLWATLATGLGTGAAVLVSGNHVASAILMLCVGVTLGLANNWGLALWNFMFPVAVATVISNVPKVVDSPIQNALINGAIAVFCMIVAGLLVSLVVKKPMQASPPKYRPLVTAMYTVNLAILFTASGFVASLWHDQLPGMWLTLTIVIIIRPHIGESLMRALERGGGTILGFLIAIGVAYSLTPTPIYFGIGLIFLEIAVLIRFHPDRPYWEYIMFLTPAVVLLAGSPSEVTDFASYRLGATIAAVVACLLLLGIERLVFWRGALTNDSGLKTSAPTVGRLSS
jgi:hypothetical protein